VSALELLLGLVPSIATGVAMGLVVWGSIRSDLKHLAREVRRSHKRLDMIDAPNYTPEG
jgi:hypothetical protein